MTNETKPTLTTEQLAQTNYTVMIPTPEQAADGFSGEDLKAERRRLYWERRDIAHADRAVTIANTGVDPWHYEDTAKTNRAEAEEDGIRYEDGPHSEFTLLRKGVKVI